MHWGEDDFVGFAKKKTDGDNKQTVPEGILIVYWNTIYKFFCIRFV